MCSDGTHLRTPRHLLAAAAPAHDFPFSHKGSPRVCVALQVDGQRYKLHLYDTAGQADFDNIRPLRSVGAIALRIDVFACGIMLIRAFVVPVAATVARTASWCASRCRARRRCKTYALVVRSPACVTTFELLAVRLSCALTFLCSRSFLALRWATSGTQRSPKTLQASRACTTLCSVTLMGLTYFLVDRAASFWWAPRRICVTATARRVRVCRSLRCCRRCSTALQMFWSGQWLTVLGVCVLLAIQARVRR